MDTNDWHYTDKEDQDVGPVTLDVLKSKWKSRELTGDSYIWHPTECSNWTLLSDLPALQRVIKPVPPPPTSRPAPPPPAAVPPPVAPRPKSVHPKKTATAANVNTSYSRTSVPAAQAYPATAGLANNQRRPSINNPNVMAAAAASAQRRSMQVNHPPEQDKSKQLSTAGAHLLQQATSSSTAGSHASSGRKGRIRLQGKVVGDWMVLKTADGVPYYHNQITDKLSWDKPDELKSSTEMMNDSGNWVWFPDPVEGYVPALLVATRPDGRTDVELENGQRAVTKRGQNVFPLSRSSLNRLEKDLVLLDSLDEGLILYNLQERFLKHQLIYTNIGTILVSINPYETHPIYTVEKIWEYRNRGNRVLEPHVYQIADEALVPLLEYGEDHSILISGESGAGKTWNTKQCLSYLTEVTTKGKQGEESIESKILAANPILEAFGNAKTVRNDNSSRFGRFTEIHFQNTGKIHGARIHNFLLEKSRVVWQQREERNYHVFYQLLRSSWKDSYGLGQPEQYKYLNQSGCYVVDGVDDAHEFEILLQAFNDLKFKQEEIVWIFELIAAILQLGNTAFISDGDEGSKLSGEAVTSMQYIVQLLHVDESALHHALTHRSINVRGTVTHIPLKPELAQDSRDALAKSIYGQLFDWLVGRINSSLNGSPQPWALIGLLDIFGFEIFETNSFEQLCINFTNEKLQQLFNRDTFKREEEMYVSEGIEFEHIKYVDNQPILDMIEKTPVGLLLMLDDMNRMPKSTDEGFVMKADKNHGTNKFFITSQITRQGNKAFTVRHYAGDVVYDADGFLVKNKDLLYADLYEVMSKSSAKNTAAMFPSMTNSVRSRFSLGAQFRKQLTKLMGILNATKTHYIRCIKPNTRKAPRNIDSPLVLEQLRYSGVFEAVRIRKQGFPFRYTYQRFVDRYKCLMIKDTTLIPPKSKEPREFTKEILAFTKQDFSGVRYGRTMALYRAEQHRLLELMRSLSLERICGVIQALVRGVIARKFVKKCLAVKPRLLTAIQSRDVDQLETALGDYARIVGQYAGMVPADIGVVRKAKRLKFTLVEWEKVCVDLDTLVRQDVRNDPNIFEALRVAVWKGEELCDEPGTEWHQQMYEYSKTMFEAERKIRLDPPLTKAMELLERDMMTEIYTECKRLRYDDPRLKEIENFVGMDEEQLIKMQYKKAKALGLQDRAKNKEIEIHELFLDAHEELFPFEKFGRLRSPEEYAHAGILANVMFWKQEELAKTMLVYTKSTVNTSLTNLDHEMSKTAVKLHKAILGFCGDKNNPSPNSLAYEIVSTGMTMGTNGNEIRDEIYCLLMKHLTLNPSHQSTSQAWKLFGLCIMHFPAAKDLLSFIHVYIRRNAPQHLKERYRDMLYESEYAGVKPPPSPTVDEITRILSTLQ